MTSLRIPHIFDNNIEKKRCGTCELYKTLDNYAKDKTKWDNLKNTCKECLLKKREIKKDQIHTQQKVYRQQNKEKIKEKHKLYEEKNRAQRNEYKKTRYNNNINVKLSENYRKRMRLALTNNNIKKQNHTQEYLGCSYNELILYIEKKFDNNMTWDNYGKYWHVDHIIPCSAFNLLDQKELYACFNYKNLQPLSIEENLKKGNKYNETDKQTYLKDFN
jgi:hypothetical protein